MSVRLPRLLLGHRNFSFRFLRVNLLVRGGEQPQYTQVRWSTLWSGFEEGSSRRSPLRLLSDKAPIVLYLYFLMLLIF